jgi:tRNA pseudouridine38-40 synthase
MRYFITLAYNGTRLSGWQRQPNAPSVQQRLEDVFSLLLRQPIEITGCGRTDAGVHARQYVAHFDYAEAFPKSFLERANQLIGQDIALYRLSPVANTAHARFDATERSYQYTLSFQKNPFFAETEWFFAQAKKLDWEKMQAAAAVLIQKNALGEPQYTAFAPFCKTHSDAQTMDCTISRSEWIFADDGALFHISANRFLRGMVRLIVGMCVNIGLGQIQLDDLHTALQNQEPLKKSYSAPPTGLFLTDIKYPFDF